MNEGKNGLTTMACACLVHDVVCSICMSMRSSSLATLLPAGQNVDFSEHVVHACGVLHINLFYARGLCPEGRSDF